MIKFVTTKFKALVVIADAASDASASVKQTTDAFFVFPNAQEIPSWTTPQNSIVA
jgi:hypothetical protein